MNPVAGGVLAALAAGAAVLPAAHADGMRVLAIDVSAEITPVVAGYIAHDTPGVLQTRQGTVLVFPVPVEMLRPAQGAGDGTSRG